MNNKILIALSACLIPCLTHANMIWPALFISNSIFETWFLIFISIVIEALFLYLFLRPISKLKALLMSCVGNAISTFGGTILSSIGMIGWHSFADKAVGGTFAHINWIATIIIMCLLSAAIELECLAFIFSFRRRKLFVPILVGNIATYLLTWCYYYLYMPSKMYPGFRIFG